mgnify:CR=1 FL=1
MSKYLKAIQEINADAEVIISVPKGEVETYSMIQWVQPSQQIDQSTLDAKVTEIANRDAHILPRRGAYPSVQKQLDMQYWDSVNGTTTWKDAIAKVKSDNPKN